VKLARIPPMILLIVLLHTGVSPHFRVFGVAADVLLLIAIAGGIVAGPERGATIGFFAGLLADCFLQTPFGLSALVFCVVGWGVGAFQSRILHAVWWIPMLTTAVAAALGMLAYAMLGAVLGESQLISARLVTVVAVVALVDALLSPLAIRGMRWALCVERRSSLMVG
jgi:rod shape-determining protein MreD